MLEHIEDLNLQEKQEAIEKAVDVLGAISTDIILPAEIVDAAIDSIASMKKLITRMARLSFDLEAINAMIEKSTEDNPETPKTPNKDELN